MLHTLVALIAVPVLATAPLNRGGERTLTRIVGPFALAGAGPLTMRMIEPVPFVMPADGFLTGYEVQVIDDDGAELPLSLLHHSELIDMGRRDLFRNRYMRLASISHDTPPLVLPAPLGYPVRRDQRLLVLPMLDNTTGRPVSVRVRITLRWRPAQPGLDFTPVATFNLNAPGKSSTSSSFDIAPGWSEHSTEFELPVAARLVAVSAHLHEYGAGIVLLRLDTGDTLFVWRPTAAGSTAPATLRMWGNGGLHLRAGTRLRVVSVYDNPTGRPIADGGMATVGGVLIPDDWRRWPPIVANDVALAADRRVLEGGAGMEHSHAH